MDPNLRVVLPSPVYIDSNPRLVARDPVKVDPNPHVAVSEPAGAECNPRLNAPYSCHIGNQPLSHKGVTCVQNAMVNPDEKIETANDAGLSKTGMAVVPVKVWIKGSKTPTVTYVFLDSGSSSTFCTETLMRQLGVSGPKTTISLTTLEKRDSLVGSFVVTDLTISDLDQNIFIKRPTLSTTPSIPVSREDITTQDDVDKWPHLSGVNFLEVLDPLEVKHSQDGGPYAL